MSESTTEYKWQLTYSYISRESIGHYKGGYKKVIEVTKGAAPSSLEINQWLLNIKRECNYQQVALVGLEILRDNNESHKVSASQVRAVENHMERHKLISYTRRIKAEWREKLDSLLQKLKQEARQDGL